MQRGQQRSLTLHWYRRILKSAFEVDWKTDEDAAYVMQEARMLFRQNQDLQDPAQIAKKLREAEMRYGLAVHYRIPYPRPYHFAQDSTRCSGMSYCAYMDSYLDEHTEENSVNAGFVSSQNNLSALGLGEHQPHRKDD